MSFNIEEQLDWHKWVTPVGLKDKPVHRWCVFPHSFTDELVSSLIDEWNLTAEDKILDPFAGAGTTILTAKEKGIPATGYDLSPFAVHAARAKVATYDFGQLKRSWKRLKHTIDPGRWNGARGEYSELVKDALPGKLLGAFDAINHSIIALDCLDVEKSFFRLALLRTIPEYSRAVPTGGWLSWVENPKRASSLLASFVRRVDQMIGDVRTTSLPRARNWRVVLGDARSLPDEHKNYTAVITSPPYPNRHDYTRVFGVELMFGFLDWTGTRDLRYQSFESHPEAHPQRPRAMKYRVSKKLERILSAIKSKDGEGKISTLLSGYFLDMYLSLREVKRVCRRDARIAYVLGNAQYFGVPVPVDELTAEIGEQAGLTCEKIAVARYRGNSAQQMGKYGRRPSRESIVQFLA